MRQEALPFGIDARPASAHERPRERSTGLPWSGEEKARPDSISKNKIADSAGTSVQEIQVFKTVRGERGDCVSGNPRATAAYTPRLSKCVRRARQGQAIRVSCPQVTRTSRAIRGGALALVGSGNCGVEAIG